MNHSYAIIETPDGHPIFTPKGEMIGKDEFADYLTVVKDWLHELDPRHYERMALDPGQEGFIDELCELFHHLNGCQKAAGEYIGPRYQKKSLAYLYCLSYIVQNQPNQNIYHAYGNAALEWQPIQTIVEHYLDLSITSGTYDGMEDAAALAQFYIDTHSSPDKAYRYAKMAYDSPFAHHDSLLDHDNIYVEALMGEYGYRGDKKYAQEAMDIVLGKIDIFRRGPKFKDRLLTMLVYLSMGLKIMSTVPLDGNKLSLEEAERLISLNRHSLGLKEICLMRLAECYLNGKNNPKDPEKAIALLESIRGAERRKRAMATLAEMYLRGEGVEKNVEEAYAIANFILIQDRICRETNMFNDDTDDVDDLILVREEAYDKLQYAEEEN